MQMPTTILVRPAILEAVRLAGSNFNQGLIRLAGLGYAMAERGRQRRSLGQLNDEMLKDIGITRTEADQERRKWFWHN